MSSIEYTKTDFERDGYVAIAPLFDKQRMQEINHELQRFITDIVPSMPTERVYFEDKSDPTSLKQIQKIFEYDDYFFNLMHHSVIREIAENLLQDQVRPINLQYFNKPPQIGQATPPHQDGYYFNLNPCDAVTGWLALESVDEKNGCVNYVKGSHRCEEFRPHGTTGVIGFSQGITDFGKPEDLANTIACPANTGTFLMHNARTIHFAGANTSATRSRRALGFIYYAERAREDLKAQQAYQAKLAASLKAAGKV